MLFWLNLQVYSPGALSKENVVLSLGLYGGPLIGMPELKRSHVESIVISAQTEYSHDQPISRPWEASIHGTYIVPIILHHRSISPQLHLEDL